MTRELRNAITRIRKAQDKVFEQKTGLSSFELTPYVLTYSSGRRGAYWSIFIHRSTKDLEIFRLHDTDTQEDINETLNAISEYIGFTI